MFKRLHLRSATLHDLPALDRLVNSAYRGDFSKQGWTTEADLLGGQRTDSETLAEMISDPNATIELAFESETSSRISGCVYLRIDGISLYLGMLTVDPALQANGIGKELLSHAEAVAAARACKQIKMTVINVRHELIAYYERRGYVLTGRTEPFPKDDPRFGIPKSDFHFVEMVKVL